jgi:hypothetical protein
MWSLRRTGKKGVTRGKRGKVEHARLHKWSQGSVFRSLCGNPLS